MNGTIGFLLLLGRVYIFIIFARVIMSWFPQGEYHPATRLLDTLTRPILAPLRRVIPPMGGMDLSPLAAILLIEIILQALARGGMQ